MYTLYNRLGSGGFAVEAALELAGVPYRLEHIESLPNQPLYDKIAHLNGWGQVPVLVLDDGTVMTELAAVLAYLAECEPGVKEGPHLWVDNRALFLRWMVFLCVNVYEGVLRESYPHRFCTLAGSEDTAGPVSDEWLKDNVAQAGWSRTHEALLCLEQGTSDSRFLVGDRMSACDVVLAMLYAWHGRQGDLPKCNWITGQVANHEGIGPIWAKHFDPWPLEV